MAYKDDHLQSVNAINLAENITEISADSWFPHGAGQKSGCVLLVDIDVYICGVGDTVQVLRTGTDTHYSVRIHIADQQICRMSCIKDYENILEVSCDTQVTSQSLFLLAPHKFEL